MEQLRHLLQDSENNAEEEVEGTEEPEEGWSVGECCLLGIACCTLELRAALITSLGPE